MRHAKRIALTACIASAGLLASEPAGAAYLEASAGWYRPWDREGLYRNPSTGRIEDPIGYYINGAALWGPRTGHARFGVQFEYQNFVSAGPRVDVLYWPGSGGVVWQPVEPQTQWDTWALDFLFQYHFLPESLIQPYVGAFLGLTVGIFDRAAYEIPTGAGIPIEARDFTSAGVGPNIGGLVGVGLQIPGVKWLSLFGEAKFSYAPLFVNANRLVDSDDFQVLNTGGIAVGGGVRFRF